MQIIYPSQLSDATRPDETFEDEFNCAQGQGIPCLLLASEAAALGKYRFSDVLRSDEAAIWRGWMMTGDEYRLLHQAVTKCGATMMTSPEEYLRNHHLPGWYDRCKEFTPETRIVSKDADFEAMLAELKWPAYFVKDYVKSLTTRRGSVARNASEIREIIALLEQFRGQIEGGICLRRFEHFKAGSEKRYFVLNKRVFAADEHIPQLVTEIAQRTDSPFFSVDVAVNDSGTLRLIEIGDGQVSDIKEWDVERFVQMLKKSDAGSHPEPVHKFV